MRFAQIENFKPELLLRGGDDAVNRVGDVGVIARHAAIAEDGNRFAGVDERREFANGQIGPLALAIDGEQAEHRHVHAVNMMINVAERFAGELARGIGRDGGKNRVALAEWHLGVYAIDRRRRSDDNFFDAAFSSGFENVHRAFDVNALVKRRCFEAGPHARARSQVDDLVEFHAAEQFVERHAVTQIAVDKFKWFGSPRGIGRAACRCGVLGRVIPRGERLDIAEVPAFEFRVVEIVEVIERPDGVAVVQQPFANVRTDETRAAGDQKVHGQTLTIGGRSVECRTVQLLTRPNKSCHPTTQTSQSKTEYLETKQFGDSLEIQEKENPCYNRYE